jgi:hypothetical protein
LEFGFEDQRTGTITPAHVEPRLLRRNEPAAVLGRPEQGGKAGGRIETWPAQPVDRSVAADQSTGLAVADQGVVFDSQRHCYSLA